MCESTSALSNCHDMGDRALLAMYNVMHCDLIKILVNLLMREFCICSY